MSPATPETALYPPVKAFLEAQGYTVKSEVGAADVVAVRGDEPPVIVELKTGFSLALFHQAIERLAVSETVYVAVPRKSGAVFHRALKANRKLCRRIGVGLLLVRLDDGHVEPVEDPGPYAPRVSKRRQGRLLKEFAKRAGDPNTGGAARRGVIVTAYRQDALRCLACLHANGPMKAALVARATGVARARTIMADNHHGWFARVSPGHYRLTDAGEAAATDHAADSAAFPPAAPESG